MKKAYDTEQITPIGIVNYRNDDRPFGIKDNDRLGHIYVIGKTGTGKSTLLQAMAISDIERGNGFCVIDPHGDVAENLLNYVPEERIGDVIYFNPADIENPVAFNPLKNVHPEFQYLVASGLISTFKKIWADNWGPRLENILRFSLLTLLQHRQATLLDIEPLLTDKSFRDSILSHLNDPFLYAFWTNEYDKWTNSFRNEAISPILNKIGIFSSSPVLRNIIGQKARSFHFSKVMDEGKILVVNLSKGKLGDDVSGILGSMIVSSIQLAALHRAKQEEHTRRSFYVYIDECHSFITHSIADILAESRKYGLSLFLAHQYVDQLHSDIRAAIFGNVGTMIAFRIGATDAEIIAKEFHPIFNEIDLVNLPRYCMYLKLMIEGTASQPFSASTQPLKSYTHSFRDEVILFSQRTYGTPLKEIHTGMANKYLKRNKTVQQNLFNL